MEFDKEKMEINFGSVGLTERLRLRFKLAFFFGLGLGIEMDNRFFFNTDVFILTVACFRFSMEFYK